jgi:hypothetical protein
MSEAIETGRARRAGRVAARLCGITPEAMGETEPADARARLARELTMYLANRVYRFSHARSAAIFGRDRRAASQACRRIQSLRDDPKFDWQLFEVETLLHAAELVARETGPRTDAS